MSFSQLSMEQIVQRAFDETTNTIAVSGGAGGGGGLTQAEAQAAFEAALIAQDQNLPNLTQAEMQAAVQAALVSGATAANIQQAMEDALIAQVTGRLDTLITKTGNIETNTADLDANTDQIEPKLDTLTTKVQDGNNLLDAIRSNVANSSPLEKYQFHHTIIDGTSSYFFFEDVTGKYLVKKMTDVSANEQVMTYANVSNNPTYTTIAAAIGNYNVLVFGNISTLTGI